MIPTSEGWAGLLRSDRPWREAYADVRRAAAEHLDGTDPSPELTTTELAERLWPARSTRGKPPAVKRARQRLFKALAAEATRGLACYCHRGDPEEIEPGKIKLPWLWHAKRTPHPEAVILPRCPHCGGEL